MTPQQAETLSKAKARGVAGLAESIDHMIAVEFRKGSAPNSFIAQLHRAARELTGRPLAWHAAEALHARVAAGDLVYIATGHVHPVALPHGETDGPPGAAGLARTLVLAQKASVVILCEESVIETVKATCSAAGLVVREERDLPMPRSIAVQAFPVDPEEARVAAEVIGAKAAAVITIEKIGPSSTGAYRTGSGSEVTQHVAKIDLLVDAAREAGALTIGIGDLGNEIGMAAISATVGEILAKGELIACSTVTDHLIVAGCSNWGAYGIAAALAALHGDVRLLHDAEVERNMIEACCAAGAVDGFSAAPTLEVDGGSWQFHSAFITMLRELVTLNLDMRIPERHSFLQTT